MKILIILSVLLSVTSVFARGGHWVRAHTRANGTVVSSYFRETGQGYSTSRKSAGGQYIAIPPIANAARRASIAWTLYESAHTSAIYATVNTAARHAEADAAYKRYLAAHAALVALRPPPSPVTIQPYVAPMPSASLTFPTVRR